MLMSGREAGWHTVRGTPRGPGCSLAKPDKDGAHQDCSGFASCLPNKPIDKGQRGKGRRFGREADRLTRGLISSGFVPEPAPSLSVRDGRRDQLGLWGQMETQWRGAVWCAGGGKGWGQR